jgi:hypothetical protein
MPTALAARKHGSEEGSKDDDLGNTPSSDKEERDGDSQKANRARKRKENNSRKVSSTTVDRSSKAAARTTRSARAGSKGPAATNKTRSTALPAPATKQGSENSSKRSIIRRGKKRAVDLNVGKHITQN